MPHCRALTTQQQLCSRRVINGSLCYQHGGGLSAPRLWAQYSSALLERLSTDSSFKGSIAELTALPKDFIPPAHHNKYMEWVVKSYIDGGIRRYEDLRSRTYPALDQFAQLLRNGRLASGAAGQPWTNETNISNFCGLVGCVSGKRARLGLEALIDKYVELEQSGASSAPGAPTETLYEDADIKIYTPHTQEESCRLGRGTKWCTAATKGENMFNEYYKPDDLLYIVVPKRPQYKGEKYQLHFGTQQYMDEQDNNHELDDLIKMYPGISQLLEVTYENHRVTLYEHNGWCILLWLRDRDKYINLTHDGGEYIDEDNSLYFSADILSADLAINYPELIEPMGLVVGYVTMCDPEKTVRPCGLIALSNDIECEYYGIDYKFPAGPHNPIAVVKYDDELLRFRQIESTKTAECFEFIKYDDLEPHSAYTAQQIARDLATITSSVTDCVPFLWIIRMGGMPDVDSVAHFCAYIPDETALGYLVDHLGPEAALRRIRVQRLWDTPAGLKTLQRIGDIIRAHHK